MLSKERFEQITSDIKKEMIKYAKTTECYIEVSESLEKDLLEYAKYHYKELLLGIRPNSTHDGLTVYYDGIFHYVFLQTDNGLRLRDIELAFVAYPVYGYYLGCYFEQIQEEHIKDKEWVIFGE